MKSNFLLKRKINRVYLNQVKKYNELLTLYLQSFLGNVSKEVVIIRSTQIILEQLKLRVLDLATLYQFTECDVGIHELIPFKSKKNISICKRCNKKIKFKK